jgi:Rad3-related DNA helicase
MKELQNTAFKPRTVLIASRDHLCVNTAINELKGGQLNAACRNQIKGIDSCIYYKNKDKGKLDMSWDPLDIENLHKEAQYHMFCPYYVVKDRARSADIIFMPYNYLIDEKIRESYGVQWENSILIFDEAHNITQATEEVTSFELRDETIKNAVLEIIKL